jgi:hypothetical protein
MLTTQYAQKLSGEQPGGVKKIMDTGEKTFYIYIYHDGPP